MKMDGMESIDVGYDEPRWFYRATDLAKALPDGTNVYAMVPPDQKRVLPSPAADGRPRTYVSEKAAIKAILLHSDASEAVLDWAVDMIAAYRNDGGRTIAVTEKPECTGVRRVDSRPATVTLAMTAVARTLVLVLLVIMCIAAFRLADMSISDVKRLLLLGVSGVSGDRWVTSD